MTVISETRPNGRAGARLSVSHVGFPVDGFIALIGLGSLIFVAFPTFGPVKISDLVLPAISARALARRPFRFPIPLFGVLAVVVAGVGVGVTGAGAPQIDVIGDWATGLESPRLYPLIVAFRIVTTAIASLEIVSIVVAHRKRMAPVLRRFLLCHLLLAVALFLIGPGRDIEGQIRGTFLERGQLARFTIVLTALVVLAHSKKHLPGVLVPVLALFAILPSLAGVALAGVFTATYLGRHLNLRLKRTSPMVVGILLALVLAVAPKFIPLVQLKVESFLVTEDPDRPAQGRYAAWRLAPTVIQASPLIGFGTGKYIFVRDSEQFGKDFAREPHDNADSPFITLLVDHGLLGGLAAAALLVFGPIGRRPSDRRAWPWILLNAALMFSGSLETPLTWIAFAMALLAPFPGSDDDVEVKSESAKKPGPTSGSVQGRFERIENLVP